MMPQSGVRFMSLFRPRLRATGKKSSSWRKALPSSSRASRSRVLPSEGVPD
jgi:hypothetical protein